MLPILSLQRVWSNHGQINDVALQQKCNLSLRAYLMLKMFGSMVNILNHTQDVSLNDIENS